MDLTPRLAQAVPRSFVVRYLEQRRWSKRRGRWGRWRDSDLGVIHVECYGRTWAALSEKFRAPEVVPCPAGVACEACGAAVGQAPKEKLGRLGWIEDGARGTYDSWRNGR